MKHQYLRYRIMFLISVCKDHCTFTCYWSTSSRQPVQLDCFTTFSSTSYCLHSRTLQTQKHLDWLMTVNWGRNLKRIIHVRKTIYQEKKKKKTHTTHDSRLMITWRFSSMCTMLCWLGNRLNYVGNTWCCLFSHNLFCYFTLYYLIS